jgi:hypothetical protein
MALRPTSDNRYKPCSGGMTSVRPIAIAIVTAVSMDIRTLFQPDSSNDLGQLQNTAGH